MMETAIALVLIFSIHYKQILTFVTLTVKYKVQVFDNFFPFLLLGLFNCFYTSIRGI